MFTVWKPDPPRLSSDGLFLLDADSLALYEQICSRYTYSIVEGQFYFKRTIANQRAGTKAGTRTSDGYGQININGKCYRTTHITLLYLTGKLPADEMDHINGVPWHDGWHNLREATRAQNAVNRASTGIYKSRNGWDAAFVWNGTYYREYFMDKDEALAWYTTLTRELRGEWNRD